MNFLDLLLHFDAYLAPLANDYGYWLYVFLWLIIFIETGCVIVPFLPGDSLLFVAGALIASQVLDPWILSISLLIATISGNAINFLCGRWFGTRWAAHENKGWARLINRQAVEKTQTFYVKHGGKTILMARFIPVIRTFAPFVAGMAKMEPKTFQFFNVIGAVLWIEGLLLLGYFFGNIPIVRDHLHTIVFIGLLSAVGPLVLLGAWRMLSSLRGRNTTR